MPIFFTKFNLFPMHAGWWIVCCYGVHQGSRLPLILLVVFMDKISERSGGEQDCLALAPQCFIFAFCKYCTFADFVRLWNSVCSGAVWPGNALGSPRTTQRVSPGRSMSGFPLLVPLPPDLILNKWKIMTKKKQRNIPDCQLQEKWLLL